MFLFKSLLVLLSVASAIRATEVTFADPPPEQIVDPEWTMIPDEAGEMHLVNTVSAMSEPVPFFNTHIGVVFELYTLANPFERQVLHAGNLHELAGSYYNGSRPTRFVVHGWNTNGGVTTTFQKAYFVDGQHDINLIAVNWQAGSNTINYIAARRRVNTVGPAVARMVDFLVEFGQSNVEDIQLIGHSLGGHIVGIAGKHVTVGQLPLIVALDPANPLFSLNKPAERVAQGDARNVHIVHTNAGTLGFSSPLGDASFYPNGGRSQPGCGWDMTGACAHSRAIDLYAESINTDLGFYSLNCESYNEVRRGRCNDGSIRQMVRMGEYKKARGIYFLETNRDTPFARGNLFGN